MCMIHIILIVGLFWHIDIIDDYDHVDDNLDDGNGTDFNDADADADVDGETGFVYVCV